MNKYDAIVVCTEVVDLPRSYGLKRVSFVEEPYHSLWFVMLTAPIDGIDKGKKYRVTIEEIPD